MHLRSVTVALNAQPFNHMMSGLWAAHMIICDPPITRMQARATCRRARWRLCTRTCWNPLAPHRACQTCPRCGTYGVCWRQDTTTASWQCCCSGWGSACERARVGVLLPKHSGGARGVGHAGGSRRDATVQIIRADLRDRRHAAAAAPVGGAARRGRQRSAAGARGAAPGCG